jgi:hypothetical protein
MDATPATTGDASVIPLNERRWALLLLVVEAAWFAGFGYVLSLIA